MWLQIFVFKSKYVGHLVKLHMLEAVVKGEETKQMVDHNKIRIGQVDAKRIK